MSAAATARSSWLRMFHVATAFHCKKRDQRRQSVHQSPTLAAARQERERESALEWEGLTVSSASMEIPFWRKKSRSCGSIILILWPQPRIKMAARSKAGQDRQ